MDDLDDRVEFEGAAMSEAKQRIVDAAADVFALKGFEATTVREITDAAGANVAAVNYHFGSKAGLLRAVLATMLGPLNQARADNLDRIEVAQPSVPHLLHALLAPLVFSRRGTDGGLVVVRLLQQMRVGPVELTSKLLSEQLDTVAHRYIEALAAAAPQFTRPEIVWRYEFARGSAMQVLGDLDPKSGRLSLLAAGNDIAADGNTVLRELIRFTAGGFGISREEIDADISRLPEMGI